MAGFCLKIPKQIPDGRLAASPGTRVRTEIGAENCELYFKFTIRPKSIRLHSIPILCSCRRDRIYGN